jgi:hypothetical protein
MKTLKNIIPSKPVGIGLVILGLTGLFTMPIRYSSNYQEIKVPITCPKGLAEFLGTSAITTLGIYNLMRKKVYSQIENIEE